MGPKDNEGEEELDVEEEGQDGGEEEGAGEEESEDRGDVVDKPAADAADGEEEEEEEEAEGGEAAAGKGKSRMVPHARFNEVNEDLKKERETRIRLEERNRVLEEQGRPIKKKEDDKPKFDFDAKEHEAAVAVIEGDAKKAAAIRREINEALRADAESSAYDRAVQTSRADRAKELLEDAASQMIEDFPFLDDQSPEANKEAIADVIDLRDVYVTRGMRPDAALRKAAAKIGAMHQEPTPRRKPKGEGDGEEEGANEGEDGQERKDKNPRKVVAIARGARAAAAQPPAIPGAGARTREDGVKVKRVDQMTDAEFNAMSPADRKKARGDAA